MRTKITLALVALTWLASQAAIAQESRLTISELMYEPLSGEAEFVELYNPTDSTIQLAAYQIARVLHDSLTTRYPLPQHAVAPHGYVCLTSSAASVISCYKIMNPTAIVECRLPTYPNSGGSVALCLADSTLVERFDYSPQQHSRLLRSRKGVSLERRSMSRPVSEPTNWFSAASTAGYATPGYANSQSSEFLAEESDFILNTTLLSPDDDDHDDILVISYTLSLPDLAARAEVYDRQGYCVRRLLAGELLGTHGAIVWDGLSDYHTRLPSGRYLLRITLFDTGGTEQVVQRTLAIVQP